jgi:hypothetical protein
LTMKIIITRTNIETSNSVRVKPPTLRSRGAEVAEFTLID